MLGLGEIDTLERRFRASISLLKKRGIQNPTLIEVVDEDGGWNESFEDAIGLPPTADFENILRRAPLFVCAVASEIGARFEGVGTEYWAKFARAINLPLTTNHRTAIADAFELLAAKYQVPAPTDSSFSNHFSIISWPIANALLPIELAGPVARMLARAPSGALPGPGREANYPALRAWASAVEGARLSDWLRLGEPSGRVIAAILSENRGAVLSEATYSRVRSVLASNSEAFRDARAARLRRRPARVLDDAIGRLTLAREGGEHRMFVTWPSLPSAFLDNARDVARAAGWRPRLWDAGPFLHPVTALGSGPFLVSLDGVPADEARPYADASVIFGEGSDLATALAARTVEWGSHLLFQVDEDRRRAEQSSDISARRGLAWVAVRTDVEALRLRHTGTTCGYRIFEANLADPADRECLEKNGLLQQRAGLRLARHPIDAIGAPPLTVRPDRPFLTYVPEDGSRDSLVRTLSNASSMGVSLGGGRTRTLRAVPAPAADGAMIDAFLFERDYAFERLIERRLQLRIESGLPLTGVDLITELEIDGRLVARGSERLQSLPATLQRNSPSLMPLYVDHVRDQLLKAGRGKLTISIGRSVALMIALQRPVVSVEWAGDAPVISAGTVSQLVSATARHPHRFEPVNEITSPARGGAAFGLRLEGGSVADPVQIYASDTFDLSDFTAHFGDDIGVRRKFWHGRGIGDVARSRVAWARGLCRSLKAVAAKSRVVEHLEEPVVVGLCGSSWWRAEKSSARHYSDAHEALFEIAMERGLAAAPSGIAASDLHLFINAFRRNAKVADPGWPISNDIPLDGAMDDAFNAAFTETVIALHAAGKLMDVDEDDCDFGSVSEDWESAAAVALKRIRLAPLAKLLVPAAGASQLVRWSYDQSTPIELAEDLSSWSRKWTLPRGHLSPDTAASALLLWLSPAACDDVDATIHALAADPFVSRASRYVALRLSAQRSAVAP